MMSILVLRQVETYSAPKLDVGEAERAAISIASTNNVPTDIAQAVSEKVTNRNAALWEKLPGGYLCDRDRARPALSPGLSLSLLSVSRIGQHPEQSLLDNQGGTQKDEENDAQEDDSEALDEDDARLLRKQMTNGDPAADEEEDMDTEDETQDLVNKADTIFKALEVEAEQMWADFDAANRKWMRASVPAKTGRILTRPNKWAGCLRCNVNIRLFGSIS
ncbi:hypothetical protein C8J56DRAFT_1096362 [Mycena floridula]|nr:hypothetical protein C8J56DRAFT_1096362 [Mycena floridula]